MSPTQQLARRGGYARVRLHYEFEAGGATERIELPFVVGVLADLSGNPPKERARLLKDRKFIQVDRENFDAVMLRLAPELNLVVENRLGEGERQLPIALRFRSLADFEPWPVARQIEPLRRLIDARAVLTDLMRALDRGLAMPAQAPVAAPAAADPGVRLEDVLTATPERARADGSRLASLLAAADASAALAAYLDDNPAAKRLERAALVARIAQDIVELDRVCNAQLRVVLHHETFQRLESAWRGLAQLVEQLEENGNAQIRALSVRWDELERDFARVLEFDQSQIFRLVYREEFDTPGGTPYGMLVCDQLVRHRPMPGHGIDDVEVLERLSQVAAAAFAPLVVGAHPALFGLDSFLDLQRPVDFARVFSQVEYLRWNALRDREDSRFLGIALPPVLARAPHGDHALRMDGFRFREDVRASDGSDLVWCNPAYSFAAVVLRAHQDHGWPAAVRGVERGIEGGGLVTNVPVWSFATDAPRIAVHPPVQVSITDAQEKQLADLGFLTLSHCQGTEWAAFYSAQSLQRPQRFQDPVATVNARLSSMLHYMLCASRFAHFVKVIGRLRVGSFATPAELEDHLSNWLIDHATSNEDLASEILARYPLSEVEVRVREEAGKPGVFQCMIRLKPHFQLDQLSGHIMLTTSLVAVRGVG